LQRLQDSKAFAIKFCHIFVKITRNGRAAAGFDNSNTVADHQKRRKRRKECGAFIEGRN
jgi:hypothetical protein